MCTHNYISMYGVCLTYMTYEMCYVIVCSLVCMFICVSASKKDMMFHVYTNFRVCIYIYICTVYNEIKTHNMLLGLCNTDCLRFSLVCLSLSIYIYVCIYI